MVDSVLLLVDAVDGPMPQTRFVTQKAFAHGLRPIVVINKIDRHEARPNWVLDQTFDLFDRLGADRRAARLPGDLHLGDPGLRVARSRAPRRRHDAAVRDHRPSTARRPTSTSTARCSCRSRTLDYSSYVGAIGIGRIKRGTLRRGMNVTVVDRQGARATSSVIAGARLPRPRAHRGGGGRAPATSSPSPASRRRRSPTRSATRRGPRRCRRSSSTSRRSA